MPGVAPGSTGSMPVVSGSGLRLLIQVAAVAITAATQLPISQDVLAPSRPWP